MIQKTWIAHFEELRKRLVFSILIIIPACIPVFIFYDLFFDWLLTPVRPVLDQKNTMLYALTVYEAFLVKLKFSFLIALIGTLPVHIFNACAFIFPGLKKKEKTFLSLILVSVFVLGAGGIVYAYNYIIPIVFNFFLDSGFFPQIVGTLLNLDSTVFLIVQLLVSFFVTMQFPIILIALLALKIVSLRALIKSSRYVVVLIFIAAAVLTPPDAFSQIAVAIPLALIYFLTIGIGLLFARRKKSVKDDTVPTGGEG